MIIAYAKSFRTRLCRRYYDFLAYQKKTRNLFTRNFCRINEQQYFYQIDENLFKIFKRRIARSKNKFIKICHFWKKIENNREITFFTYFSTTRNLFKFDELITWLHFALRKYIQIVSKSKNWVFSQWVCRRKRSSYLFQQKLTSFDVLQNILTKSFYLIHSNTKKQLFLDFDVNKKFDFDVILYYVKKIFHKNDDKYFSRHVIESIFFLSRFIINAKSKYWFIELKIIEIIWILKKTRYIVEITFDIIIIYTNYDVAIDIAKQITLIIILINKLNFRLMRAFDYIQFFNLDIKYKLEKQHIMSNVLFKFVNNNTKFARQKYWRKRI